MMIYRLVPSLIFAVAVLMSTPGSSAYAQDASSPDAMSQRTVTVTGTGEAAAAPDQAIVRFAIETRAADAETARNQNAEASRDAMNAVRSLAVADDDMQLEALMLRPRREYNRQTGQTEDLGYVAVRRIRVELSNIDDLPELIAKIVNEGANRLEGVDYDLKDRSSLENDALRSAAETARSKAALLASTLGVTLGPVQQIDEQNFSYVQPRPNIRLETMSMQASDQGAGEPEAFAAGRITVEARVQVTFLLTDNG